MFLAHQHGLRQSIKIADLHYGKDSPLDGDESPDIGVTGGRPGPSSHYCLSNRLKSNSKIQMGILTALTIKTMNRQAREN